MQERCGTSFVTLLKIPYEANALFKSKSLNSVLLLSILTMVGCGESGPLVVPVSGSLTLDGEPLAFKSLTLLPAQGTTGQGAGGYSDGEGNYYLIAVVANATRDFRGCPPGKYRVVVSEPMIPMTEADFVNPTVDSDDGDEPAPAVFLPDDVGKKKPSKGDIPTIYTSDKTTPLLIDVVEGTDTIDIELDSNA